MKKKKLHKTYIFILMGLLLLVSACEKEVELEQKEEAQKLAIICSFSPDEPFSIHVSKSHSLFSNTTQNDITTEADVQICEADILLEKILPNPNGSNIEDKGTRYQSVAAIPKTQKKYTLKINMDGVEPISAVSLIPNPVQITQVEIGEIHSWLYPSLPNEKGYEVETTLTFVDAPDETNFYQVNFYQELTSSDPSLVGDTTKTIMASTQGWLSADETIPVSQNLTDYGFLFRDFTFDGEVKELTFNPVFQYQFTKYEPSNIIVELRTVSKEYYYYHSSVFQQQKQLLEKGNKPFSDPVVVYSNIKNGYGVFAGYSKNRMKKSINL